MGCSRKYPNREGVEDTFLNPPWNFLFSYFTPGNSRQNKMLYPWIFHKIVKSLEIPRPKTKTPVNSTLFFRHYCTFVPLSWSPLEISFLIDPQKFLMLCPWYPWKFHILNPTRLNFSGIAQMPGQQDIQGLPR